MEKNPTLSCFVTNTDHHVAAAERHEEAAESHRNAAAYYNYGDYQQANEQALLAEGYGKLAEAHCALAIK